MTTRSIVWFRRDLRLRDHPALAEACAHGAVLPVFVVDPAFDSAGAPRRALLHDCLAALDEATGGALVVRHGDPTDEIPALADEIDASTVYVSKDFAPYGRRRDESVADALRGADRRLRGIGSPYAVEPGTVRKDDGDPYSVFTPFSKKWRACGWAEPIAAPRPRLDRGAVGRAARPTRRRDRHPVRERGRRHRPLAAVPRRWSGRVRRACATCRRSTARAASHRSSSTA
ncbi:MAG: deoxyribodipyrimidine photo-lyase [Ilumatobacteraceae bacterium]